MRLVSVTDTFDLNELLDRSEQWLNTNTPTVEDARVYLARLYSIGYLEDLARNSPRVGQVFERLVLPTLESGESLNAFFSGTTGTSTDLIWFLAAVGETSSVVRKILAQEWNSAQPQIRENVQHVLGISPRGKRLTITPEFLSDPRFVAFLRRNPHRTVSHLLDIPIEEIEASEFSSCGVLRPSLLIPLLNSRGHNSLPTFPLLDLWEGLFPGFIDKNLCAIMPLVATEQLTRLFQRFPIPPNQEWAVLIHWVGGGSAHLSEMVFDLMRNTPWDADKFREFFQVFSLGNGQKDEQNVDDFAQIWVEQMPREQWGWVSDLIADSGFLLSNTSIRERLILERETHTLGGSSSKRRL